MRHVSSKRLACFDSVDWLPSAPPEDEPIGNIFGDFVDTVVGGATSVVNAVDNAYKAVVPQEIRKGLGAATGPLKTAWDFADNVAHGQRIDVAAGNAVKNTVNDIATYAPYAQAVVSFLPGIGPGVSAALGGAVALAQGKPITDAAIAAAKGLIPGGPLAQGAFDLATRTVAAAATGKPIDGAALDTLRANIPGGAPAQAAFDAGVALMHGKKLQDAGLAAAGGLVPNTPAAQAAFAVAKKALAGGGGGAPAGGPVRVGAFRAPAPAPAPSPARTTFAPSGVVSPSTVSVLRAANLRPVTTAPAMRVMRGPVRALDAAPAPAAKNHHWAAYAIGAVGVTALVSGGAWWLLRDKEGGAK